MHVTAGDDRNRVMVRVKLLGELSDSGVLPNDEFERQKQRILGG